MAALRTTLKLRATCVAAQGDGASKRSLPEEHNEQQCRPDRDSRIGEVERPEPPGLDADVDEIGDPSWR